MPWPAAIAVLAALIAAGGCAFACRRLRGTTLAAPAAWAVVAAAVLALVEAYLAVRGSAVGELQRTISRMLAAAGTFCPPMAVLGAKRPQDRGWQWIVASLWVIVALPALHAWLIPAGARLELATVWVGFLGVVAVYGTVLNYGPTRFATASILYLAAQAALTAPATAWRTSLPWSDDAWAAVGAALALAAMLAAFAANGTAEDELRFGNASTGRSPTARWLAFRNAFGMSWALRIQRRVNETAELAEWPVRLSWDGFAPIAAFDNSQERPDNSPTSAETRHDPDADAAVNATLDTLLRRFERQER